MVGRAANWEEWVDLSSQLLYPRTIWRKRTWCVTLGIEEYFSYIYLGVYGLIIITLIAIVAYILYNAGKGKKI